MRVSISLATLSLCLATGVALRAQSALLFTPWQPQNLTAWQGVGMGALDCQELALA